MPKEILDVQWGSKVLHYGVSLKFGVAPAFAFGQLEVTPIPVLVPRLRQPPIHWPMLHSFMLPSGPSHAGLGDVLSVSLGRPLTGWVKSPGEVGCDS